MNLTRYWVTCCDWHSDLKDYASEDGRDIEVYKASEVQAMVREVIRQLETLRDYTYLDAEPPELRAQNARCHSIACQLLTTLQEIGHE